MSRATATVIAGAAVLAGLATRASGYAVGPPSSIEALAGSADLVCKATALAERRATDAWFEPLDGFDVVETQLRVVSTIKGAATKTIWFRHYARSTTSARVSSFTPQLYSFAIGRTYIVFASHVEADIYHQQSKRSTEKPDEGVWLAADERPHHGTTATGAVIAELRALLASKRSDDATYGINQLDELSGGHHMNAHDLERPVALAAIRPMIGSSSSDVATAAIGVFGEDSPSFDDQLAMFWLAGIGKGTLSGIEPLTPNAHPTAQLATRELLAVANGHADAAVRARAIRALGRARDQTSLAAWLRDPAPAVHAAAVRVSSDRATIASAATDPAPELRRAAALAIGFAQDPAWLPLLDPLLADATPEVQAAAALSLLSFAPERTAALMRAHLATSFRPLFVNVLARRDPQPYLADLADVIVHHLTPDHWWGGSIPAGDSWRILFDYVKARPAAELAAAKLQPSLDALEHMQWFDSSAPVELYTLYVRRGLSARAKRFRDATRANATFDMDAYFDQADQHPETYVP